MSKYTYESRFKIGAIYERDLVTPKESHLFRVGREGVIGNLNHNTPMFFTYADGHGTLITSNVIEFEETDYGVWVTTENSVYRLDNIF